MTHVNARSNRTFAWCPAPVHWQLTSSSFLCFLFLPLPSPLRPIRRCLKETSTWRAPVRGGLSSWPCCQSPSGQVSMWAWPWRSSPTSPRTTTGRLVVREENYPSDTGNVFEMFLFTWSTALRWAFPRPVSPRRWAGGRLPVCRRRWRLFNQNMLRRSCFYMLFLHGSTVRQVTREFCRTQTWNL